MSIELRPDHTLFAAPGDLAEVIASNVSVHLEVLDTNTVMLIIQDDTRHVQLRITHRGRVPLRVWQYESCAKEGEA